MKHLHLNCYNGAAGDMLTGALLGLCPNISYGILSLNSIGLGKYGVVYGKEVAETSGITGLHLTVTIGDVEEDEAYHYSKTLGSISNIFDGLSLSNTAKNHAKAIYQRIAIAEGKIHGEVPEQIHFHEVGALDAIADVAGFCHLLERLEVTSVTASPIAVGSGTVKCAHGILPVPAPATAVLLEGIPSWAGVSTGELCTPTGAAILGHFVENFGDCPSICLENTAYGFGRKLFPKAVNAVTASLGTLGGLVVELSCNLDDMTGEHLAFATELLLTEGALDVWTAPIYMKKGRPAVTLFCLSDLTRAQHLRECIFRHTTTLGVRTQTYNRQILPREVQEISGIPTKIATGYGVTKSKPEFENLAKQARKSGAPL
ncbi:MAG: LarC family nickel insertion protein [Eubacteriales bacterium]